MDILIALIIFGGAFAILLKSASYFVGGAVRIAKLTKIPKIVIGIVVVGLATTSPELAVSVQSAWLGHPEIALGNGIGSVIADDALALALAVIIAGSIVIRKRVLKSIGIFLILVACFSYALAIDAEVGRFEGIVLLSLIVGYYYWLLRSERHRKTETKTKKEHKHFYSKEKLKILAVFAIGATGVIISSRLVIWSGLSIADFFGLPEVVLGLTMIALGTSLPEISTAVVSARKGEGELAVGNILGADVLNILLIIGASAAVNPIQVSPQTIEFAYPWMLLVVVTMLLSMRHHYKLTRKKGLLLLSLYIIYLLQLVRFYF